MLHARKPQVLFDMCTQRDYLDPAGARPVVNAADVARNVKHVMAFARWAKLPAVSCIDVRRVDDARGLTSPACVDGTAGQRKPAFTLLPSRVLVDCDNCLCVPLDILDRHQQAILTKESRDPFTNPKLDRLLTELPVRGYTVFGAGLENSIRLLVLGLLLRGQRVTLVSDACGYWNDMEATMTLRQLEAKGCELISTIRLIERLSQAQQELRPRRPLRRRSVA